MVFNFAIKTLFADPNLRELATYVNFKDETKEVSVITERPDVFRDSMILTPSLVMHVLKADCHDIKPEEIFVINKKEYRVQGEPKLDSLNLIWKVDLV